jgi:hypothetical protein
MLPPKSKLKTVPAKLVAAFDASGKEATGLVVVAGFLSSQKDWRAFDVEWRTRLKNDGLDYFHMVDFAGSRKQLAKGWKEDEPRRQSLLKDLIDIVKSYAYRQFACAIEMSTFSLLSDENKNRYNPYVLAARSCAADIRLWQVQEKFYVPTAYVFEEGDGGVGMMTDNFLGDNLPIPAFKPKKDTILPDGTTSVAYTPLQAADILAYELHKPHKDILAGKPRVSKFRWALEQLSEIPGIPGYYSAENIVQLNRRLDEARASSEKSVDNPEPTLIDRPEITA